MKNTLVILCLCLSISAIAQQPVEHLELGLSTNAVAQYFPVTTSPYLNLNADISHSIADSQTYQLGILTTFQLTSISSVMKLAATTTIHFTDTEWKNAFFLRPLLGWQRDTIGSVLTSGIVYGIQVGKRFAITDQLMFRPQVEFSRDAANNAQIVFTPISLSLFISGPKFF